jgi:hypothetical protein
MTWSVWPTALGDERDEVAGEHASGVAITEVLLPLRCLRGSKDASSCCGTGDRDEPQPGFGLRGRAQRMLIRSPTAAGPVCTACTHPFTGVPALWPNRQAVALSLMLM